MNKWNSMHTHKRSKFLIQYRSIHIKAIWIRTIQHQKFNIILSTGFHNIMQCRNISIKSCPNILNVENNNIYSAFQELGKGIDLESLTKIDEAQCKNKNINPPI